MQPLNYRIAWIARGDERYGVARAILSLASSMQQRGCKCLLFVQSQGEFANQAAAMGMQVIDLQLPLAPDFAGSAITAWRSLFAMAGYIAAHARALRRQIRSNQLDVVHVQWPNQLPLAATAALGTSCDVVWEMPNIIGSRHRFSINRFCYQWLCRICGVSVLANSAFTADSFGRSPLRAQVFYLGVDAELFDPARVTAARREQYGLTPSAFVLGMVARLHPSKGQLLAISAVADLVAKGIDTELVLVGGPTDGEYATQLHIHARQLDVAERIRFFGESAQPESLYPLFDCSLQLRTDPEPFGLSVIESMMMAVPVAAHALGGPAETVVDGETGWLFAPATREALQEALRRALAVRAQWPALRRQARAHAIAHFSLAVQAERYAAILRQLRGTASEHIKQARAGQ